MSRTPEENDYSWASQGAEDFLRNLKDEPSEKPTGETKFTSEDAQELLEKNYFGRLALSKIMGAFKGMGIPLDSLWYPQAGTTKEDIDFAKEHNEMLFLLPSGITFGKMSVPITINNVSSIFESIYSGSDKPISPLRNRWYARQLFAGLPPASAPIHLQPQPLTNSELREYKKVLSESEAKAKVVRDPSIIEVVLAELIYHSLNKRMLFPTPVITNSLTNQGQPVYFGGFTASGLVIVEGTSPQAYYYPVRVKE